MIITRRLEFDAGHRIPDHGGQCRNVHGHRYVVEVSFSGQVNQEIGEPDTGMVLDFGSLKTILVDAIHKPWDHAFLCYEGDELMVRALGKFLIDTKFVLLPFVPTAENLAAEIMRVLIEHTNGLWIKPVHVRLYETPNCWADVTNGEP
jgi:6-pyruvoyltetrahydropterin/6-carboxytetrahydropterin synthase